MSQTKKPTAKSTTIEYRAWITMRSRCSDPKRIDFHRYGGNGVKVCAEWLNDFDRFLSDVGFRPTHRHALVRIARGDYTPENTRWETLARAGLRRRNAARKASDAERVPYNTAKRLLANGWTPPTTP
jgi:hypothetical protein